MKMRRIALTILLSALPAVTLLAQQHPNQIKGFHPDKAYASGRIDDINLFNGNLTITIPLGQPIQVNGGLKYGLTLTWNANLWDFEDVWRDTTVPPDGNEERYTAAFPSRRSNAGFGWIVSLGRLIDYSDPTNSSGKWIYESPDGAEHYFYPKLHTEDEQAPLVSYTTDSSYLRMKDLGSTRTIEFPDGTIHTFALSDSVWRLTEIRDRYAGPVNYLRVEYPAGTNGATDWQLTDSLGRVQYVRFERRFMDGREVDMVDKIQLKSFGALTATYDFEYENLQTPRPCDDDDPPPGGTSLHPSSPFLSSLTLPDSSQYSFAYATGTASSCTPYAALMNKVTLPTLGAVEWDYDFYRKPALSANEPYFQFSLGVYTRRLRDEGGAVIEKTRFKPALDRAWDTNGTPRPREMKIAVTSVTDPIAQDPFSDPMGSFHHDLSAGHKQVHYFSVAVENEAGWDYADYGLPFTRNALDPSDSTRFLSTRQHSSSDTTLASPLVSTWVRYERDTPPYSEKGNVRAVSRATSYGDSAYSSNVTFSDFDGLGHYRRELTGGTFPAPASNVKDSFVNYNAGRGTYPGTFVLPLPTDPWTLGTYTYKSTTENGRTERTNYCFDSSTGTLKGKRALKNTTSSLTSSNDIVTLPDLDATGNTIAETFFGGERNPVPDDLTALCAYRTRGSAYTVAHTYQYGAPKTMQYGGTSFKSLDLTNDFSTAVPASSRDSAGFETTYVYDLMDRLTKVIPAEGAWTLYTYTRATTSASLAKVVAKQFAQGAAETSTPLTEQEYLYDAQGRISIERVLRPGVTRPWATRETRYDTSGRKHQVSEWEGTAAPAHFTTYTYDFSGRPLTVTLPDNSVSTYSYNGAQKVQRTSSIATSESAEQSITTEEKYDRFGRLVAVIEDAGTGRTNRTTEYRYDAGNRLSEVCAGPGCAQRRTFEYDGLGLLRKEVHPETGEIHYGNYDALGNMGWRRYGSSNDLFDLLYGYDAAGRLTTVTELNTNRILKNLIYGDLAGNGPTNRRNGKLVQATRYNYNRFDRQVEVTQSFVYGGKGGRPSNLSTSVQGRSATNVLFNYATFGQNFEYDDLGAAKSVLYPQCTSANCASVARTIQPSYSQGLLTAVQGLPAYGSFIDVPPGSQFHDEVETIFQNGITSGCAAAMYCPSAATTQGQMAVFLLRSKLGASYTPPAASGTVFADVGTNFPAAWIEDLDRRGISQQDERSLRCPQPAPPARNYCPNNTVTRADMAVLLLRAKWGSTYTPGPYPTGFTDLTLVDTFYKSWIEQLVAQGITSGCTATTYCPTAANTRLQMAVFLKRTFSMVLDRTPVAYASSITYHPNGLYNVIAHGNQVSTVQTINPATAMARPTSIGTSNAQTNWNSGTYLYDGSGNVKRIGNDQYVYDVFGRLLRGTADNNLGYSRKQAYTYDTFGNVTGMTTTVNNGSPASRTFSVSAATNRLTGETYDNAGNQTRWNGGAYFYDYDGANMMRRLRAGSTKDEMYVYTADDERIWTFDTVTDKSRWTLRGLDAKVLREWTELGSYAADGTLEGVHSWTLEKDYIYRGGALLASTGPAGTRHFHSDHLGTPRLITNSDVNRSSEPHAYYPFGEEAATAAGTERMKFTGHERDLISAGDVNSLDYMHGRHYSSAMGRFLSVDPGKDWDILQPQSWNMYSYVRNNPINKTDPTGKWAFPWELLDLASYQQSSRQWTESAYEFKANPTWGNAGNASVKFIVAALDGAALLLPAVPAAGGHTQRIVNATTETVTQLQKNKAAGDAFRDKVADFMTSQGRDVKKEVVKHTPFGDRRIDVQVSMNGKVLGGIETKTGNSRYTASQRVKDWWLRTFENYIVNVVREAK